MVFEVVRCVMVVGDNCDGWFEFVDFWNDCI